MKTKADALPCLGVTTKNGQLLFYLVPTQSMNNNPGGEGGRKLAYIKTPLISFFFFPRKTVLLVHTFMCIRQVDSSLGFTKELNKNES